MSSDRRCRGGCRRAACGPEEERIAGFLKKSFRAAGIQTAAFLGFRAAKAALFFMGCEYHELLHEFSCKIQIYKEEELPCEPILSTSGQKN
jgi:hypothetical protein